MWLLKNILKLPMHEMTEIVKTGHGLLAIILVNKNLLIKGVRFYVEHE